MTTPTQLLADIAAGHRPSATQAMQLLQVADDALAGVAAGLTRVGHGRQLSYSRKVFIPLTQLCRDVCHYCTFAIAPRRVQAPYLAAEQVLEIARAGARAGCKEALFTLGDKPELRYPAARRALTELGCQSTLAYLREMAALVLRETGLLPHLNCGVMDDGELASLRPVAASMGLMLESASERLCERGGPHFGSPDKLPARRLATIAAAGRQCIPFTSGLLVGIGETRAERIESLLALRELHDQYGHVQELIIQNFRAKPGTKMANAPEPSLAEQCWTIAVARLLFGAAMSIQAPPNLQPDGQGELVAAGINDWGGVSPVTPDHVNPEAPWPQLSALERTTADAGGVLVERLTIYPAYLHARQRWLDAAVHGAALRHADVLGMAREDGWYAGLQTELPASAGGMTLAPRSDAVAPALAERLARAHAGETLTESDIVSLFAARGDDLRAVLNAADVLRAERVGDVVSYVVNRNINYTNVCVYRCGFCAFSKGRATEALRGRPYDLDDEEIGRRVAEAWQRGATEVCLQGGIHPDYDGRTYLHVLRIVKQAAPDIHVHAFSPLEVSHGASTLGLSLHEFLAELKSAGLGTLPGTAAEILDDEVRAIICPDKVDTQGWLDVMEAAHSLDLRSTATIMFGHVDATAHWARHLLRVRGLQARTGGFTEFVPLPFVHAEAPIWRRGQARSGPTFREAVLMHAVARLVLHPLIDNVQASWVKMGPQGTALCLAAGVNDLGGVLMNESITRAAGGTQGQELGPASLERIIRDAGRTPRQRNTLYGEVTADRRQTARRAAALASVVNTPLQPRRGCASRHADA